MTPSTAQETALKYPRERIRAQLEVFDWLVAHQDAKVSRNPPGFLISSIKSQYAPPRNFVRREEQARREERAAERRRRLEERERQREAREQERDRTRQRVIQEFWQALSEDERVRLEQEAVAQAPPFQRALLEQGGSLAANARKAILDAYALHSL